MLVYIHPLLYIQQRHDEGENERVEKTMEGSGCGGTSRGFLIENVFLT